MDHEDVHTRGVSTFTSTSSSSNILYSPTRPEIVRFLELLKNGGSGLLSDGSVSAEERLWDAVFPRIPVLGTAVALGNNARAPAGAKTHVAHYPARDAATWTVLESAPMPSIVRRVAGTVAVASFETAQAALTALVSEHAADEGDGGFAVAKVDGAALADGWEPARAGTLVNTSRAAVSRLGPVLVECQCRSADAPLSTWIELPFPLLTVAPQTRGPVLVRLETADLASDATSAEPVLDTAEPHPLYENALAMLCEQFEADCALGRDTRASSRPVSAKPARSSVMPPAPTRPATAQVSRPPTARPGPLVKVVRGGFSFRGKPGVSPSLARPAVQPPRRQRSLETLIIVRPISLERRSSGANPPRA